MELRAVLLGRGRRRRQPLAVHRRRPARGAEVLPRHAAGRRGAPRRLLQALHARGRRARRRRRRQRPARDRAGADLRLPAHVRVSRPVHRRAAPRPLADQARPVRDALPRHRRGDARAARPALHRGLPHPARGPARVLRRDAQRRPRRAAPHRLRREAARRPPPRGPGGPGRRRGAAPRGAPVERRRARAARLGPLLHGVLRLHARGDLRGGRALVREQAARGRDARGRAPRPDPVPVRPLPRRPGEADDPAPPGRDPGRGHAGGGPRPGDDVRAVRLAAARRRPPHRARRAR